MPYALLPLLNEQCTTLFDTEYNRVKQFTRRDRYQDNFNKYILAPGHKETCQENLINECRLKSNKIFRN